jgi:hypothetical protein
MSATKSKVEVQEQIWKAYLQEYNYWVQKLGVNAGLYNVYHAWANYMPDRYHYGTVEIEAINALGFLEPVAYSVHVLLNSHYDDWFDSNREINIDKIGYLGQHLAVKLKLIESNIHKYFNERQFDGVVENCLSFALSQEDFLDREMFEEYLKNFIPN